MQNAFTIQKLFLDLDTAVPESSPTIQGPLAGSALWQLIEKVFMGAYFKQLRQKGDPVLSYSFTVDAPRPTTLELGSVSRECCVKNERRQQEFSLHLSITPRRQP